MSRPGLDSGAQVCTVLLVSLFPHMELRGEDLWRCPLQRVWWGRNIPKSAWWMLGHPPHRQRSEGETSPDAKLYIISFQQYDYDSHYFTPNYQQRRLWDLYSLYLHQDPGKGYPLTEMHTRWAGPPPGLRTGSFEGDRLTAQEYAGSTGHGIATCLPGTGSVKEAHQKRSCLIKKRERNSETAILWWQISFYFIIMELFIF